MYRQVILHPHDGGRAPFKMYRNLYRMKTVTFGVFSSANHAQRVLVELANDEVERCPLASAIVKRDFYIWMIVFRALAI